MYQKTVLGNGIRVVTETIPHFHSVSTGIWCNLGSRDERESEKGITHFIEHMLFRGTRRRSSLDIAKELDAVGGFANAFTSKENLCVHAKVLDNHLPLIVDILTDIFLHSVFNSEEIEREREVILQEIGMIEDTPDEYVHILFQERFWKGHSLGTPIYGSDASIECFRRELIFQYMAEAFSPESILVAAAGNVEHQTFLDLIGPELEAIPYQGKPVLREPPKNGRVLQVIPKDLEQVHICLGMDGCSLLDESRFACHLLNVVLGSSMSSRLFQEIRERRGLAYSVFSFLNSYQDAGILGVYAGVGPGRVTETLEAIMEMLQELAVKSISEPELQAAREYIRGNMYLGAESTDSRMNRLAKNELLFNRLIPFEEIEDRLNQVAAEDIREWLAEVFQPDKLSMLLLGPTEWGEVEKVRR